MYHRRHVATSVDIWNRELRKGLEFTQEFKKVLPDAMEHTYRHATADVQGIIRRVVNIWDEREVFDKDFLDELRRRFTGIINVRIAVFNTYYLNPSILSQQLDHLLRVLTEHQNLVSKSITNRTQLINQMKEIIAQEEMRLRLDNKSLLDTQSKINETKECIEQLKSISIFRYDANKNIHNGESRFDQNGEIRQKDHQQQHAMKENDSKSRSIKQNETSQQLTKVEVDSQGSTSSTYDPSIHLTLPPSSFTSGSMLPSETQLFGDSFSLMNDQLQVPYQSTSISSSISNSPAPSSNSDEYSDPLVSTDHRG
ncbi:9183_t:CDS:2 [Racocetra fulgida]|uniref:9183_t:CDS:1 n=1 Tax=Racocetra fulgida TaxID=60492 RepID=A0A9N9CL71_9GLOM|nr:9183_t:CDS:2 [Racocetra fulgida]